MHMFCAVVTGTELTWTTWNCAGAEAALTVGDQGTALYFTAVTMQSDGDGAADCTTCALATVGRVYIEGATPVTTLSQMHVFHALSTM